MLRYSLVLALVLGGGTSSLRADFPDGVLEETQHDFGVVPRGQQLVHYFRIANKTDKPLHIYNVRVSCGCTQAHALDNTIAPGKETAIWASMDSSRFYGYKQVTIYVSFDQPQYTELRTAVIAQSREDLAFSGTGINFGKVPAGESKAGAMNITFYRGNIQLLDPIAESSFVVPSLKEVRRTATETVYEVDAKLRPDTPAGLWFTDVWVKTNDPGIAKLRVPLTVEVQKVQAAVATPKATTPTNSAPDKTKPAVKPTTPAAPTTPTSAEPTSLQTPTTDEPPMADPLQTVTTEPRLAAQTISGPSPTTASTIAPFAPSTESPSYPPQQRTSMFSYFFGRR
ncbi:MAG TPA: DUF1573 domain-containing protein [Gemmataceae bacterium]|jgi:hypothetical protein|nr:DUF1573 domain-containing protein [Gemmataceae bacterium]